MLYNLIHCYNKSSKTLTLEVYESKVNPKKLVIPSLIATDNLIYVGY